MWSRIVLGQPRVDSPSCGQWSIETYRQTRIGVSALSISSVTATVVLHEIPVKRCPNERIHAVSFAKSWCMESSPAKAFGDSNTECTKQVGTRPWRYSLADPFAESCRNTI